jgi:hypothetical protein
MARRNDVAVLVPNQSFHIQRNSAPESVRRTDAHRNRQPSSELSARKSLVTWFANSLVWPHLLSWTSMCRPMPGPKPLGRTRARGIWLRSSARRPPRADLSQVTWITCTIMFRPEIARSRCILVDGDEWPNDPLSSCGGSE